LNHRDRRHSDAQCNSVPLSLCGFFLQVSEYTAFYIICSDRLVITINSHEQAASPV
jgi:hypothetical protein